MRQLFLAAALLAGICPAEAHSPTTARFGFDGALPPIEFPWFRFNTTTASVPNGAPSSVIVSSATGGTVAPAALIQELSQSDLVYVGEGHDQVLHHQIQLEVIKVLHTLNSGLQIGLEMLDTTQQTTLDAYLDGSMTEADFSEFWRGAWGYPFSLYKPILDYAKVNGIPVRALNAPISVIRDIARNGLSSLSPEQRALLPDEINAIKDPRYLAYVKKSLSEHGPMPPEAMERMLQAMAAWNETMAQSLTDALPQGSVVVIAGMGHVFYGSGILESVRTRAHPSQASVLPYPLDGSSAPLDELLLKLKDPANGDMSLADYFWLNPED